MPFTVIHGAGMTKDSEYREYARLLNQDLFKRDVNLADVPRIEEPGTDHRWLYVWAAEGEARDFAERLNKQVRASHWVVRPLQEGTAPSHGPLRPIEIQMGRQRNGWTFALAPWVHRAIRTRYPGSCRTESVFVASDSEVDAPPIPENLGRLAGQFLLVLTGLEASQLEVFEDYVVMDPVSGRELLPPTTIRPRG